MRLGFIGFGELAHEMAKGFKGEGLRDTVAFDPAIDAPEYGALMWQRAVAAGVELLAAPGEVIARADVIIAATPGSSALQAAETIAGDLSPNKLYADFSSSSPLTKKKIAAAVGASGAGFVDGGVMGALRMLQHKVPILVSGSGSDRFIATMTPYHMSLEKVSDTAGDAVAIKLVRSIYTKGVLTLHVEMIEAAIALGVEDAVHASLSKSLDGRTFMQMVNYFITSGAIHAERQAHEMQDCMAMLNDLGIAPIMTEATVLRLKRLADKNLKETFQGQVPATWQEVVSKWG